MSVENWNEKKKKQLDTNSCCGVIDEHNIKYNFSAVHCDVLKNDSFNSIAHLSKI